MKFEKSHIVIAGLAILGIAVLYFMFANKPIHNEGMAELGETTKDGVDDLIDKLNAEEIKEHPIKAAEDQVGPATVGKLKWKNQATGKYVASSYADGARGNAPADEWDEFYKTNTDLVEKSYIQNNDKFMPVDETNGNMAAYSGMGHTKNTPEDLFKADKLLPQEVQPDWFEVMPEPIKVKNRHLVNVTRPVGVNTIGSSKRNASYDLRGSLPVAKTVISPFLQSSIMPDLNIKGLC